MDKDRVAEILLEIGVLLELKGENPFKTRAYGAAARAIEVLPEPLAKVVAEKRLGEIKGIGEAKAIAIVAALELGRRRRQISPEEKPKIAGSKDAFELLKPDLTDLPHEEFWVLLLNRANRLIRKVQISQGGVAGTVADPKIIYKAALDELASGIIVAHNHPSGNLTASQADISLTQRLRDGGKLLEIQVLDHLILAGHNYFSFADEGIL